MAGVHSWTVAASPSDERSCLLAGPSIFHLHFASPGAFRRKYLHKAASPEPPGPRPFQPSPAETAALGLIRALQRAGADQATIAARLDELYRELTGFSESEIDLLEEAGLILTPELPKN